MDKNIKPFMSYIPREFVKSRGITFEIPSLKLIISHENWPKNLIHNQELIHSDDIFYEQMCSDTSLYFYVKSALGRIKSLISRAAHESNTAWEHGSINIFDVAGDVPQPWMTRTRTEIALRPLKS